jgi:hypothetical protein
MEHVAVAYFYYPPVRGWVVLIDTWLWFACVALLREWVRLLGAVDYGFAKAEWFPELSGACVLCTQRGSVVRFTWSPRSLCEPGGVAGNETSALC